ncbi:MAG: hypothetical protein KatS3mg030_701 [Saprospiraceae bacterium]|nr:MAG: hypothetical protein KatS3mg030_701 [Saprospiraceae bacterium]
MRTTCVIILFTLSNSLTIALADTITAKSSGDWSTAGTWDCNCIPKAGDVINIPSPYTVTISNNIDFRNQAANTINITGGVLLFQGNRTLYLATGSVINWTSGDIDPQSNGNNVFISIGNNCNSAPCQYTGSELNNMSPPIQLTEAGESPLPIELISFQARRAKDKVLLVWRTASELDNAGFEVHRSSDGHLWNRIGWVEGRGTSLQPTNYQYLDAMAPSTGVYYRLRQVDFDGKAEVLPVVFVPGTTDETVPAIFPNPTRSGSAHLLLPDEWTDSNIHIYDAGGVLVWQQCAEHTSFLLPTLPHGVYLVRLMSPVRTHTLRLVVAAD